MAVDFEVANSRREGSATQLGFRFGKDVLAAATAALSITPIVCLIDSTIILKAATRQSFTQCLKHFVTPVSRLPQSLLTSVPARLVFGVYLGTYATANAIDTMTSFARSSPPADVTASTSKFIGTAAVSTGLTVYKDSRIARCLGSSLRAATPMTTYSLFTLRDAITIFASFNLPTLIAPKIGNLPLAVKERFGTILHNESGRLKTAQLLLPAAIQIVTTPIHLLGLDFYNRQSRVGVFSRLNHVIKDMVVAVPARMIRIVPAFGMGGIINASARKALMERRGAEEAIALGKVAELPRSISGCGEVLVSEMLNDLSSQDLSAIQTKEAIMAPAETRKDHVVAILGCGFMGTALLSGILASKGSKEWPVKKFYACVKRQESADRLKSTFAPHSEVEVVSGDRFQALRSADCVILGFQPGDVKKILGDIEVSRALAGKLVISMLAGVTCGMISGILAAEGFSAHTIRVIPSIGAQINQSCSLVSETELPHSDMALVRWIFSQVGSITFVPEDLLNTAVAISATSHALTTTVVDAITDGSVSRGMPRAVALKLAAECLRSASSLLLEKMTLEELKDSMSVPRGITTEAWIHLEAGNIRSATAQSVRHAVDYAEGMS